MEPYSLIESKETYRGKIITVNMDTIMLPNGERTVREIVRRGGAAAVLPVDANGNIIFVRQYRHPARAFTLELPAGMLDEGEEPEACARRELEEETGMVAGEIRPFFKMYPTIGLCDETLHLFLASDLRQGTQHTDPDEFVEVERYSPEEAAAMIFDGRIMDGKTIAGVLAYLYIGRK
ncbi:MAG: NUDIX hydrolase [Clostridiales bacterium]|jgi:ADP-ribose pyrophosphatase|nr:NUDIX hydrolase [Clostridiales bacterium]